MNLFAKRTFLLIQPPLDLMGLHSDFVKILYMSWDISPIFPDSNSICVGYGKISLEIFWDFLHFYMSLDLSEPLNNLYGRNSHSIYIRIIKCVQEKIIIANKNLQIFMSLFNSIQIFLSTPNQRKILKKIVR